MCNLSDLKVHLRSILINFAGYQPEEKNETKMSVEFYNYLE